MTRLNPLASPWRENSYPVFKYSASPLLITQNLWTTVSTFLHHWLGNCKLNTSNYQHALLKILQFHLLFVDAQISRCSLFLVYVNPVVAATAFLTLSEFQQSHTSEK